MFGSLLVSSKAEETIEYRPGNTNSEIATTQGIETISKYTLLTVYWTYQGSALSLCIYRWTIPRYWFG